MHARPYSIVSIKKEYRLKFRTLFIQEMLKNKVLMPWVSIAYRHNERELDLTLSAIKKSLKIYQMGLETGAGKFIKVM